MGLVILLSILAAVALYGFSIHGKLAALRHDVARAWSGIDELLGRRHDELPRLVEACERHAPLDRAMLARLAKAGASVLQAAGCGDVAAAGAAESLLRAAIGRLLVAADDPATEAGDPLPRLRAGVARLLDDIAARCELYNGAVNLYNLRLGQFPDRVVARLSGFRAAALFEFVDGRQPGPVAPAPG